MTRYGGRTFNRADAGLLNALPGDLRSITNLQTFKTHWKTELFKRAHISQNLVTVQRSEQSYGLMSAIEVLLIII